MSGATVLLANTYFAYSNYLKAGDRYSKETTIPYIFSDFALFYNYLAVTPLQNDLNRKEAYLDNSMMALGFFWLGNVVDAHAVQIQ